MLNGVKNMDVQQNLALFQGLMLVSGDVYTWCYDADGKLLSSNCPDQAVFATVFDTFGCLKKMLAMASERHTPTFLSTETGLVWGAAFEKHEDTLYRCHVIGPVFYSSTSASVIYRGVHGMNLSSYSVAWQDAFFQALYRVPTVPFTIFSRNVQMLHYCVTGERIGISDVFVDDIAASPGSTAQPQRDRYRVWQAENALLMMVKHGDLDYRNALSNSMMLSDGVPMDTKDPVRNGKTSVIVFCSIVCRAAIQGGLSPEEAYALGDAYIRSAEGARTIDELSAISMTMYDDFIHRVHRTREKPKYSEPIRRCCQYIEMHLDRNVHARELAALVNYSVTHLTRRFREETGIGIPDFARAVRMERAKVLLTSTDLSIQEISEQLGFSTRSYFTRSFREETGVTPTEYRTKK